MEGVQTLDVFLPTASESDIGSVVYQLFDDLYNAHAHGVIYGDRWSQNMLILPGKNELIHIDFDLEIGGQPALEFEVAQVIYYTLCANKEKALPLLAKILGEGRHWFNFRLVNQFLKRHAEYFAASPRYGGASGEVAALSEVVYLQKKLI